ncbi:GNAT family N-acetyltransferase [Enterococcus durans]|uniref:GNAT family N-acetyltransferase n=1 Tax=Enterococcus TaxID=1350 RepID=UPI00288E0D88|nr:GNAT family N-acetyltransferase [Enterococcus durans]MDT2837139.1 GNAT family N-acetyltransferase [Enterococcus durans]
MKGYQLIKLRERPEWKKQAAEWFSSKWHLPYSVYEESIDEAISKVQPVPQWYIVLNEDEEIIAGAGIIDNDFHDRPDLTPNLCALFVEKEYRNQGIAQEILILARKDMKNMGIERLYLVTDHTDFYERYDWEFLAMVQDNEGIPVRMYQIDTAED